MSNEQAYFTVEIPIAGALTVSTGVLRYTVPVNAQLVNAVAAINTAPTGTAAILTLKKNGTAITPAAALTIPASANVSNTLAVAGSTDNTSTVTAALTQGASAVGNYTLIDHTQVPVANAVPGDYFTVDVTQIGGTTAGSDAVVSLTFIHR